MPKRYPEDVRVFNQLKKHGTPADLEKFSTLMRRAHSQGKSAIELVRESQRRTTSKLIRELCLAKAVELAT